MANYKDVSQVEAYKRIYPVGSMYRPHVETDYNDDALSNQAGDSDKNIFLIGSATDGNPEEVVEVKEEVKRNDPIEDDMEIPTFLRRRR